MWDFVQESVLLRGTRWNSSVRGLRDVVDVEGEPDRKERCKWRNEEGVWRSLELLREGEVVGVAGAFKANKSDYNHSVNLTIRTS